MKSLNLSFSTAKELRARMESLPSGPKWEIQVLDAEGYETQKPVVLLYRDGLECIESLYHNPLFGDYIQHIPHRIYTSPDRKTRIYSEWFSANMAWAIQVRIITLMIFQ
jgi:hypothetical protein